MVMKLGMEHYVLKLYKVHVNDLFYNNVKFGETCFCKAQISGERLQDHWSSGFIVLIVGPGTR